MEPRAHLRVCIPLCVVLRDSKGFPVSLCPFWKLRYDKPPLPLRLSVLVL